jgi:hypothetical protein
VNEDEVEEVEVTGRLEEMTGGGWATDPGVLGGGEIADISTEGSERSFLFLVLSVCVGPVCLLLSVDSAVLIIFSFSLCFCVCVSPRSSVVFPLAAVLPVRTCVSDSTVSQRERKGRNEEVQDKTR